MKQTFPRFDMARDPIRTRWYLKPITDTWYIYPQGADFAVTKMALATEILYFHHRRSIGKPCRPGLA